MIQFRRVYEAELAKCTHTELAEQVPRVLGTEELGIVEQKGEWLRRIKAVELRWSEEKEKLRKQGSDKSMKRSELLEAYREAAYAQFIFGLKESQDFWPLYESMLSTCNEEQLQLPALEKFDPSRHVRLCDLSDDLKRMWLCWIRVAKHSPQHCSPYERAADALFHAELYLHCALQGSRFALRIVRGGTLVRFGNSQSLLHSDGE